jgi:hypothetical protein
MKIRKRHQPFDFQRASGTPDGAAPVASRGAARNAAEEPPTRVADPQPSGPLVPPQGVATVAAQASRTPVKRPAPRSTVVDDPSVPPAWPVYLTALVVFVLWAGLPVAFALGYRNAVVPFRFEPFAAAVFGLLIAGPGAFVWIAAYMVRQGQRLSAETQRAKRLADEMIGPAIAAGLDTGDVVQSVREEIRRASEAAEEACQTLLALRSALAAESEQLATSTGVAVKSAEALSQNLGRERSEMGALGQALGAQAAKVADTITQQARMVAEASDLAETQLREAEALLAARAADLAAAAGEASDAARTAGEDLNRHVARLETAGSGLSQQIGALESGLAQQRSALIAVSAGLREDQDSFAAQAETHSAQLAEFISQARLSVVEMGDRATKGGEALKALMAEAKQQLSLFSDAASAERREFSNSTIQSMEAVAAAAAEERRKLETQARTGIEALATAAEETRAAAARHAEMARDQVEQLSEAAFEAGQNANKVFESRLSEARALIEQSSSMVEQAGAISARKLEEGAAAARDTLAELQRVLGEIEERAAKLPATAQGHAEQVRNAVSDSLDDLMDQARRTAEETQAIDAAFQERVRRNYDMLSEAVRLMGTVAGGAPAPMPAPREPRPSRARVEPVAEPTAVVEAPPAPPPASVAPVEAPPEAPRPAVASEPQPDPSDQRPRLRLTPTATDEEFSSIFEAAGGSAEERAPESEGWTWKELLTSIEDEPENLEDSLLAEIASMGIDPLALLPDAKIEEIAVVVQAGDRDGAREVVRKLAPAAIRRISRRLLTDQALRSRIADFLQRQDERLKETGGRPEAPELASALLGSDAGRAYLLLDAAVGDVV